jgi:nucleoside-diphosphate-sugar epimerase
MHVDDGVTPLHAVVATSAPDVCFHLAGYFVGTHVDSDVAPLIVDNLLFGTRLADAVAARGDGLIVNAGTYWQNAGGGEYHPVDLYAATKQAFQDVLQFYVESDRVRVLTLKFFETYGVNDRRRKLVNLLLHAAATGMPLGVSPGRQLIDLVHVDDAANACLAAAQLLRTAPPAEPTSYAVTSRSPLRLRTLVRRIESIIGTGVPVEWGAREYRWREMMESWEVAATVPGWAPTITLDEGIGALWASLRHNQGMVSGA